MAAFSKEPLSQPDWSTCPVKKLDVNANNMNKAEISNNNPQTKRKVSPCKYSFRLPTLVNVFSNDGLPAFLLVGFCVLCGAVVFLAIE